MIQTTRKVKVEIKYLKKINIADKQRKKSHVTAQAKDGMTTQ